MVYLVNSIGECVDPSCRLGADSTCSSISKDCLCDMEYHSALLMVLSALTSAAMFGFKISTLETIKYSMEMQSKLDEERAALVAEFDTAILSPISRKRVSEILHHHPNPDVSILSHHDPRRRHYVEASPPRQVRSAAGPRTCQVDRQLRPLPFTMA